MRLGRAAGVEVCDGAVSAASGKASWYTKWASHTVRARRVAHPRLFIQASRTLDRGRPAGPVAGRA